MGKKTPLTEPPHPLAAVPAAYLTRGYEALRSQQLGTAPRETGLGRALIVHKGMAEWLTIWAGGWSGEPPRATPRHGSTSGGDPEPLPLDAALQTDLTRVLAGMVLATASPAPQEVHP